MKRIITFLILASWLTSSVALAVCDKNIAESTPSSRFVLKGGEAYDQQTQLTWKRCSVGTTWTSDAGCIGKVKLLGLDKAKQLAQALGGGWRVPTIQELYSIVEQRCFNPTINTRVFPAVKNFGEGTPYWSDTRVEEIPSLIYFIDFIDGAIDGHSKGFPLAVRLVRSEP
ncbi:DUF1566 domain-containing protein [uncultured Amphritea sp.]|uniref:Lcl C-terminal domain-containing protein n=1 Tax=uncultured Amphritea sp. TaxID=981605 RepID=UPI00261A5218|nr:DUF1566 domain-containing protein [uncultured Amphritea sp.]